MASSDSGEGGSGLADGSVGSIVWVRRRNGSWWPGKILGPEELSATHLMSPRSGTPVKLLGREDASVDWYNLEKSKRVKAFRCGEFSDCIEKAEAVQGLPVKKREKYARREDAILHALELEKEFLEKKDGKTSGSTANIQNNSLDSAVKEFVSSSGTPLNGNLRNCNHDLRKVHQNDDSSAEHEGDDSTCAHGANNGAWISSELQNLEIKPQRINLPVYGFRTAPSKVSVAPSAAINDSHSSLIKASTHGHDYPIFAADVRSQSFAEGNFRNSMNERDMLLERIPEESTLKGHVKQITLLQQLQSEKIIDHSLQPVDNIVSMTGREDTGNNSRVKRRRTALFSTGSGGFMRNRVGPNIDLEVPISQLGVVNEQPHSGAFVDGTSGSSEDTETDSSDTNCIIPVMNAERAVYSDVFIHTEAHSSALNRLDIMAGHESTSSEESDEFSVDDRSHFHLRDIRCPSGVSRWQLKGKRNVRNLTRRSMDGFAPDPYIHGDGRYFNRSRNHSLRYNENGEKYINEADFIDDGCEPHTERFGDVGYLSEIKAASKQQVGQSSFDWDGLTSGDRFLRGFLGERGDHYYPVYGGQSGHGMLIDVDVQVQAKHQGEHVPWVSLMSRLNGKAIVGHPIQVEKLDDGSTDVLVSARGALGNFRLHNVENSVPQVWRTAQRTSSSRVPRPPGLSRSDDYEAGRYSHAKKSGPESSGSKRGSARKNVSNVARHSHQRMKKPLGKGSISVSQKTKALSSIGIDQKLGRRLRNLSYDYEMDGVIKPLISGPTTVACIPVKLVFSRLLEAIGRPPSGPVYHGVSVNQQP